MIPMEIYSSKKMESWWGQFWDSFSATFICQPLKIRFLIPSINLIFIYNILLLTNNTDEINIIHETFQNNSVLNFTQKINISNKIPFLCVLKDTNMTDLPPLHIKNLPTLIPAPSIAIMNVPSVIKEQS